jgi:hypothetical protein
LSRWLFGSPWALYLASLYIFIESGVSSYHHGSREIYAVELALLRDETDTADRVFISIVVTNASPSTQELTAQLGFRVIGSVAKDNVTPAVDLKLLINNVPDSRSSISRRETE